MDAFETAHNLHENRVGEEICFLCGVQLAERHENHKNSLRPEHVVPVWAQRRYRLHNLELILRNSTGLKYRNTTVPACRQCNCTYLHQLETRIANATLRGWEEAQHVTDFEWYLWVGKIVWGLHYKDCLLRADRASSSGAPLGDRAEADQISIVRHVLQYVRLGPDHWRCIQSVPCTVLVFRCQTPDEPDANWDLLNNLRPRVTGIRLGPVGVIIVHRDESVIREHFANCLLPLRFMELHPAQFREAYSVVLGYASHQMRLSHYHTFAESTTDWTGWNISLIPAWTTSPRELFDANMDGERIVRFNHAYQEYPESMRDHELSVVINEAGDYVPISFEQLPTCSAGTVFRAPQLIDHGNLPHISWMHELRDRYRRYCDSNPEHHCETEKPAT